MLSPTAGVVSTGSDLQPMFDKDAAKAKANREAALKRTPAGAQGMAVAFPSGKGRVVISGEAGMMTAQCLGKNRRTEVRRSAEQWAGKFSETIIVNTCWTFCTGFRVPYSKYVPDLHEIRGAVSTVLSRQNLGSVSYTHLTLPTKRIV